VGLYVVWPPGRAPARSLVVRIATGVAVAGVAAGTLLYVTAPSARSVPTSTTLATSNTASAAVRQVSRDGSRLVVATSGTLPARTWTLSKTSVSASASQHVTMAGRPAQVFSIAGVISGDPAGLPARASIVQLAALAGGRLPLGISAGSEAATVPVRYTTTAGLTVSVDATTGRVVDVAYTRSTTAVATLADGPTSIGVVRTQSVSATPTAVTSAVTAARAQAVTARRRSDRHDLAALAWVAAALAAAAALMARRPDVGPDADAQPDVDVPVTQPASAAARPAATPTTRRAARVGS
jgi:high-affinity iron transporter